MNQRENGPIPVEYLLWKNEQIDGHNWWVTIISCLHSLPGDSFRHAVTGMISKYTYALGVQITLGLICDRSTGAIGDRWRYSSR